MTTDDTYECPLCMEPADFDDIDFYPCPCNYQICRFCWSKIISEGNGLCPACRKTFNSENPASFKPKSEKEIKAHMDKVERKRKAVVTRKVKTAVVVAPNDSREHLAEYRVLQRNLIFVVGLPTRMYSDCEVLKGEDFFGKVGKVYKVVVNQNHTFPGPQGSPTLSGYVTYHKADDAFRALIDLRPLEIDGRQVKLSLGTTKYCSQFLKFKKCNKAECMYLHEMGDKAASFTKEDMAEGKHTKYEEILLREFQRSNEQKTSTAASRDFTVANGQSFSNNGILNSRSLSLSCSNQRQSDGHSRKKNPSLNSISDAFSHYASSNTVDTAASARQQFKSSSKCLLGDDTNRSLYNGDSSHISQQQQSHYQKQQSYSRVSKCNAVGFAFDNTKASSPRFSPIGHSRPPQQTSDYAASVVRTGFHTTPDFSTVAAGSATAAMVATADKVGISCSRRSGSESSSSQRSTTADQMTSVSMVNESLQKKSASGSDVNGTDVDYGNSSFQNSHKGQSTSTAASSLNGGLKPFIHQNGDARNGLTASNFPDSCFDVEDDIDFDPISVSRQMLEKLVDEENARKDADSAVYQQQQSQYYHHYPQQQQLLLPQYKCPHSLLHNSSRSYAESSACFQNGLSSKSNSGSSCASQTVPPASHPMSGEASADVSSMEGAATATFNTAATITNNASAKSSAVSATSSSSCMPQPYDPAFLSMLQHFQQMSGFSAPLSSNGSHQAINGSGLNLPSQMALVTQAFLPCQQQPTQACAASLVRPNSEAFQNNRDFVNNNNDMFLPNSFVQSPVDVVNHSSRNNHNDLINQTQYFANSSWSTDVGSSHLPLINHPHHNNSNNNLSLLGSSSVNYATTKCGLASNNGSDSMLTNKLYSPSQHGLFMPPLGNPNLHQMHLMPAHPLLPPSLQQSLYNDASCSNAFQQTQQQPSQHNSSTGASSCLKASTTSDSGVSAANAAHTWMQRG